MLVAATVIVRFRSDGSTKPVAAPRTPANLAFVAATSATATSTTTTTPVLTAPPHTVMVIGDSGTWDMAPAFEAGLSAVGVHLINASFPGEGLTVPDGIRGLWELVADRDRPDFFIVSIGTWDDAYIATNGWAAYEHEINDTVRMLTKRGNHVLWLSMMPSDATMPDGHAQARLQERLFSALPLQHPGVVDYLDISSALTAPDGTTPRVLGDRLLRKPDDWHLCPDGAAAIVHAVLRHLALDGEGWDRGAWRRDGRYDDPHGACPNTG